MRHFGNFSLLLPHQNCHPMQNEIPTITPTETQPEIQTTNCEAMTTSDAEQSNRVKCLNCGTEFEGKFCPECGQSADTGRFTMRFIFENLAAAFTSKDGGIWFTLKNLFTRPGAMIVEILNGKRKNYFSPFPMLFFALTVYILLFSFTGSRDTFDRIEKSLLEGGKSGDIEVSIIDNEETQESNATIMRYFGKCLGFYNRHYTTVYMLTLPFFLFATRVCYGKKNRKRYFRAEYVIPIVYAMVMVVLYRCLISLVYLVLPDISNEMGTLMPVVIIIAFTACFRRMLGFSIANTAWRSLLAVLLYYVVLFFLIIMGIIALAVILLAIYE